MLGWGDFGRGSLLLLLPTACAGCGAVVATGVALCTKCRPALLPDAAPAAPAPLAGWAAGVPYEGAWADWIRRFKYPRTGLAGLSPGAEAVVRWMILAAAARAPGPPPDLVVPIPQHPRRLRARGFSPAARLARILARQWRVAFAPLALERVRDTPSQTGLGRSARERNVAGAFRVTPGAVHAPLAGRIWLVDDVVTTGSTLVSAARALRQAGAGPMLGICAARRGPPR